jgi:hypothetical protein
MLRFQILKYRILNRRRFLGEEQARDHVPDLKAAYCSADQLRP